MQADNIFAELPNQLDAEVFDSLINGNGTRIERILSQGHCSPASGWYDQNEHEWVLVLEGGARLEFEGKGEIALGAGDHVLIPAHVRHRVSWTDPERITVWLAVFYRAEDSTHGR